MRPRLDWGRRGPRTGERMESHSKGWKEEMRERHWTLPLGPIRGSRRKRHTLKMGGNKRTSLCRSQKTDSLSRSVRDETDPGFVLMSLTESQGEWRRPRRESVCACPDVWTAGTVVGATILAGLRCDELAQDFVRTHTHTHGHSLSWAWDSTFPEYLYAATNTHTHTQIYWCSVSTSIYPQSTRCNTQTYAQTRGAARLLVWRFFSR